MLLKPASGLCGLRCRYCFYHDETTKREQASYGIMEEAVLEAVIRRASECGAAAPAVPVKDTVKRARDGLVTATLDRAELRAVQTPQVFQVDLIKTALQKALEDGAELTDDCAAVERLGIGVALTEGDYCNLKLTTPEDLAVARAILEQEEPVL